LTPAAPVATRTNPPNGLRSTAACVGFVREAVGRASPRRVARLPAGADLGCQPCR
jgi:hypothetical protein